MEPPEEPYTPLSPLIFPDFSSLPSSGNSTPESPRSPPKYDFSIPADGDVKTYLESMDQMIDQFFHRSTFKVDKMCNRIDRINKRLKNIPKGRTTYFELLSKYKSTVKEFQMLIRTMQENKRKLLKDNEEQREKNKELRKIMALQTSGIRKSLSHEEASFRLRRKKKSKRRRDTISEILQLQQRLQNRWKEHREVEKKKKLEISEETEKTNRNSNQVETTKEIEESKTSESSKLNISNISNIAKKSDLRQQILEKKVDAFNKANQMVRNMNNMILQPHPIIDFGSNVVWKDKNFQKLLREMSTAKRRCRFLDDQNSKLLANLQTLNKQANFLRFRNERLRKDLVAKKDFVDLKKISRIELQRFEKSISEYQSSKKESEEDDGDLGFSFGEKEGEGGKIKSKNREQRSIILNQNVVKFKELPDGKYVKYEIVNKGEYEEIKKKEQQEILEEYNIVAKEEGKKKPHVSLRLQNLKIGFRLV